LILKNPDRIQRVSAGTVARPAAKAESRGHRIGRPRLAATGGQSGASRITFPDAEGFPLCIASATYNGSICRPVIFDILLIFLPAAGSAKPAAKDTG
jgi:hypothetical protein